MNLSTVKLFLEVAEAGSLSRIAARRQTAQSHISRQITDFEEQCGGRLFRRTGRGVELTEHGVRAAVQLRAWLQATEQLAQDLRADAGVLKGVVQLGIIPSAAHPLVTRLFSEMRAAHPGVRLCIAEAQGADLDAMLDAGTVDLAVLFRSRRPGGGDERLLSVASTYLVSAPGDALTKASTVNFAQLQGLRLVLPLRPSHWRGALDDAARSLGFKLEAEVEADSLAVQKELVAQTLGLYSVLGPYSIASELRSGKLQATRVVRPDLCRHVTLALPRQGKLSPATRVVANTIEQIVRSWGNQLVGQE